MRANRTRKAKLSSSIPSHLLSFSLTVLSFYLSSAESHVVWPFPPGVPVILTAVPAASAVADGGMSAYLSNNMWVAVQLCRAVDLVWCWDYWETFKSLSSRKEGLTGLRDSKNGYVSFALTRVSLSDFPLL